MSLETRVNGLTAWANFRLKLVGHDAIENILTDFMDGDNLKILVESLTGRTFKKLKTFEGLSLSQKEIRLRWIVDELKTCEIIDESFTLDYRLIATKVANEVFKFFWVIVCYDLQFLWFRSDFLQQKQVESLVTHPIEYVPPAPMNSNEGANILVELMSKQSIDEKVSSKNASTERDKKIINQSKLRYPYAPLQCLFDMINSHLKMTRVGRKLQKIANFEDLVDSRVLCALVNSIVPGTLTAEVLLNDRWSINLALQIMLEMSQCSSPFYAEDLVQADHIAVGSYFAFFFMSGYSLCQSRAVVLRIDAIKMDIRKRREELSTFPPVIYKEEMLIRKRLIEEMLVGYNNELRKIEENYKVASCREWMKEIKICQQKEGKPTGRAKTNDGPKKVECLKRLQKQALPFENRLSKELENIEKKYPRVVDSLPRSDNLTANSIPDISEATSCEKLLSIRHKTIHIFQKNKTSLLNATLLKDLDTLTTTLSETCKELFQKPVNNSTQDPLQGTQNNTPRENLSGVPKNQVVNYAILTQLKYLMINLGNNADRCKKLLKPNQ